jgi:hypothetical protein
MPSRRSVLTTLGSTVATLAASGTGGADVALADAGADLPQGFPPVESFGVDDADVPDSFPTNDVPESFPTVSTFNHFAARNAAGDVELVDDESPTSYDLQGDWNCYSEPDELQVYVHGFVSESPRLWARYLAQQAAVGLADANYTDAFSVAVSWDSNVEWADATEIAERNALKLGQWLRHLRATDDRPIRLLCHSLGARVTCSLLEELRVDASRFYSSQTPYVTLEEGTVDSVALLGAAIDNDTPEVDERWGAAIEHAAGELHNYYSRRDDVLGESYYGIDQTEALGHTGIAHPSDAPSNYADHDVTETVDDHDDYDNPHDGVLDRFVEDVST